MNNNIEKLMNNPTYLPGVHCPACYSTSHQNFLRAERVQNSHSRYCDAYICSPCGVEEAFKGFFWREKALQRGFTLNAK